jgi:2-methylfumaryl-CoA isomerase
MAGNPALLAAAQDAAGTIPGHLAVLASPAEAQPAIADDVRMGNGRQSGFARDFATADGQRVMVAALTRQQFADLATAARLARTFAFLERVLYADFSTSGDLYAYRGVIAALLAPWFSRRTLAELAATFAGTSVPWARLHTLTGRRGSRRCGTEGDGR